MIFIVSLIALLIERFFDWSHLRSWQWYEVYENKITKRFATLPPYLMLALILLPLVIMTILLDYLLKGILYGVIRLVFQTVILIYCLGPKNFWADIFESMTALKSTNATTAREKLQANFGIMHDTSTTLHRRFLDVIFIQANARVFAVLFWFAIIGPAGALLYRLTALAANQMNDRITSIARTFYELLNWLPIRCFTFLFALGGHFVSVLFAWRDGVFLGIDSNENLLTECGAAALGTEDPSKIPQDDSPERQAIALIDRSMIITLIIIGLVNAII